MTFCPIEPLQAIFQSILWFMSAVFIHIIICRIKGTQKFVLHGLVFAVALIAALIAWQIYAKKLNLAVIYYVLTLWLAYLMFFINLLNSVTLKMLDYLSSKGGQLEERNFSEIFGNNNAIPSRIDAIKANGFLIEKEGKLILDKKSVFLIKTVRLMRKIFGVNIVG